MDDKKIHNEEFDDEIHEDELPDVTPVEDDDGDDEIEVHFNDENIPRSIERGFFCK